MQQDTDGYYLLTSQADLLAIAKDLSANYRLANDIAVAGGAITLPGQSSWIGGTFTGILDGNGHTIDFSGTSFTYEKGGAVFFNTIAGTVKNLTVTGVEITSIATGGCQQSVFGSTCKNATFTNVHVTAKMTQANSHNVNLGAFVGKVTEACTVTIENCSTNWMGTLIKGVFGGFVGAVTEAGSRIVITDSVSKGTFDAGAGTAGGFVGNVTAGEVTVTDCTSEAKLTAGTVQDFVGKMSDPNQVTITTTPTAES